MAKKVGCLLNLIGKYGSESALVEPLTAVQENQLDRQSTAGEVITAMSLCSEPDLRDLLAVLLKHDLMW